MLRRGRQTPILHIPRRERVRGGGGGRGELPPSLDYPGQLLGEQYALVGRGSTENSRILYGNGSISIVLRQGRSCTHRRLLLQGSVC